MDLPDYVTLEPAPAPDAGRAPAVSLIIPAFNEAFRIEPYLFEIHAWFEARRERHEIIVVDDGSRDDTSGVVRALMARIPALKLARYTQNRGKGHAVRVGMGIARGDLRAFLDADGSTPIAEFEKLRLGIQQDHYDIVIGSRTLGLQHSRHVRLHRRLMARAFRGLRDTLLPLGFHDTQCGCKLFTASAAQYVFSRSRLNGLAFDVELLYLAQTARLKILETAVRWEDSAPSRIRIWRDSLGMAFDLLKMRHLRRTSCTLGKTSTVRPE